MYFIGYGIGIGQNLAWGYSSWQATIKAWHDEVEIFTYGGGNNFGAVGHYTQVKSTLNRQHFIVRQESCF